MEITINENWTIEPDNFGWILRYYEVNYNLKKDGSKPKSYGQPVVRETTYPARITAAVKHIAEHEAKETFPNLVSFKERIDKLEENIGRIIKEGKANKKYV